MQSLVPRQDIARFNLEQPAMFGVDLVDFVLHLTEFIAFMRAGSADIIGLSNNLDQEIRVGFNGFGDFFIIFDKIRRIASAFKAEGT